VSNARDGNQARVGQGPCDLGSLQPISQRRRQDLASLRRPGGQQLQVGTRTTVTAGGSGYIYLAYNDSAYSDNTGAYSATIAINGPGPVASP
jgi:hypothetical protein